jgi:hypothetical protein
MKYFIINLTRLSVLCKIGTSCQTKPIDCKNFKTGKFIFHNAFTRTDILITRTDSLQTSVDQKTGIGNKSKIEWTGQCGFKLTFLSFIVDGKDSTFGQTGVWTATTDIIRTTSNYYISETRLQGEQGVHTDTAWLSGQ